MSERLVGLRHLGHLHFFTDLPAVEVDELASELFPSLSTFDSMSHLMARELPVGPDFTGPLRLRRPF
jgi:hypothetical protein